MKNILLENNFLGKSAAREIDKHIIEALKEGASTISSSDTLSLKDIKQAIKALRKNENKPTFEIWFNNKFPFIHWGYFYTVYKYN